MPDKQVQASGENLGKNAEPAVIENLTQTVLIEQLGLLGAGEHPQFLPHRSARGDLGNHAIKQVSGVDGPFLVAGDQLGVGFDCGRGASKGRELVDSRLREISDREVLGIHADVLQLTLVLALSPAKIVSLGLVVSFFARLSRVNPLSS